MFGMSITRETKFSSCGATSTQAKDQCARQVCSSSVTGAINTTLGSSTGTQVFAGLRADPFFIDLSQFFKILPDRRPATGPLSAAQTPVATWRPLCAADGSNAATCAKDFLNGINALAIVIELPVSQVKSGGKFGVWGTTSR